MSLLGMVIVAIVTLAVVMVAHHNIVQAEIKAMNASPGAVVQGILTRQERAD